MPTVRRAQRFVALMQDLADETLETRAALPVVGALKEVRFYHDGRQVCVACETRRVAG